MAESVCQGTKDPWRVLEFYSGIGGMRYSLMKAGVNHHVVEAFEINDKANDVYQHNFGRRPYQGNIQSLTEIDLDSYGANVWLLSPPCQPYTRQGLRKHSADARAFSFLNILELIPRMSKPPNMLLVENVVGFETSDTHEKMVQVLAKSDFVTQEFILSPLQFGVPYSRPRYFCLAKQKPLAFQCQLFNNQLLWSPSPLFGEKTVIGENGQSQENWDKLIDSCQPIEKFLELTSSSDQVDMETISFMNTDDSANGRETSDKFVEGNACDFGYIDQFVVPLSLIERWGSAMDIVYPDSKRCCCFTKSYYRYVKGTGSLLATVQPKNKGKTSSLKDQCLRYFTPREVANLHSFPKDFQFPEHISLRQRYAMLGNSLSVAVVAPLLQYMFAEPTGRLKFLSNANGIEAPLGSRLKTLVVDDEVVASSIRTAFCLPKGSSGTAGFEEMFLDTTFTANCTALHPCIICGLFDEGFNERAADKQRSHPQVTSSTGNVMKSWGYAGIVLV